MRKLALILVTLLVGGALGMLGWQVGFAATPPDTLVVCQRPGADLRSPATNGACPSGYTKTEISETPSSPLVAYRATGVALDGELPGEVVKLTLPPGSYTLIATGELAYVDRVECVLSDGANNLDQVGFATPIGSTDPVLGSMSGGIESLAPVTIRIECSPAGADTSLYLEWKLTATRVDDVVQP